MASKWVAPIISILLAVMIFLRVCSVRVIMLSPSVLLINMVWHISFPRNLICFVSVLIAWVKTPCQRMLFPWLLSGCIMLVPTCHHVPAVMSACRTCLLRFTMPLYIPWHPTLLAVWYGIRASRILAILNHMQITWENSWVAGVSFGKSLHCHSVSYN